MKAATYPSSAGEKTQPAAIHEQVAIKICNFTYILTSSCSRLFPTHMCAILLISLPSTVPLSLTGDPLPPCQCLLFIRGHLRNQSNVENVLSSSTELY